MDLSEILEYVDRDVTVQIVSGYEPHRTLFTGNAEAARIYYLQWDLGSVTAVCLTVGIINDAEREKAVPVFRVVVCEE